MKLLILAESLRINSTSSGIGRSKFIKSLEDGGHDITCLYENSHDITEINFLDSVKLYPVTYSLRKKSWIDKIPKMRGIMTHLTLYHIDHQHKVNEWIKSINYFISKSKFDSIIVLGSGSSFIPHYAMLEIKTSIPWLANFHDPFPMSLYPEPYKASTNRIYKRQEKSTRDIIDKATFVSFPSLLLKEWMQSFFPNIKEKSIILPHVGMKLNNLPDLLIDHEVQLEPNKFNILHAGTLLGPRNIKSLFTAFERFINYDDEIKKHAVLNVLGKIAKEQVEIIASNKENCNLNIITDRVSYKRSLKLTVDANVSLIIEADSDISPFMPGKLADLIFLEKPILALTPKNSETLRILGHNYPFTSRVNDEEQIFIKLLELWYLWKEQKLELPEKNRLKDYVSAKRFNNEVEKLFKKN
jgi:hypothetical protein|tara:strand:- start:138 stop:1376 length:1239 start_codon:yes stop_codon:yes gene_type:complete